MYDPDTLDFKPGGAAEGSGAGGEEGGPSPGGGPGCRRRNGSLATGLRRQEIMDPKWGDLCLNAIASYVQLRAEATKARRGDRVMLADTLAADE